jgi:energy-coupling factor transporter ATP-binding protein EcfA2
MRLLELEIHNVRGIRHLRLRPDGDNLVIWGPNGSGKSAVVDAIDFLLTGRISRLSGRGTAGITLRAHGPHIDCEPRDAKVRGLFSLAQEATPVSIERCMATPSWVQCPSDVKRRLQPILDLARRGQHVLTRRDILRYITAERGTRGQEIQALLDLRDLARIRKALVQTNRQLKAQREAAKSAVATAKAAVGATVGGKGYSDSAVLRFVNARRRILQGEALRQVKGRHLKEGIVPPAPMPRDKVVNSAIFKQDVSSLIAAISEDSIRLMMSRERQLRSLLKTIRSDPQLQRELSRSELIQLGLRLIGESGECPLCEARWPPGKLRRVLEGRLQKALLVAEQQSDVEDTASHMISLVDNVLANLENVARSAERAGLRRQIGVLRKWRADLEALAHILSKPVDRYPDPRFDAEQVGHMLAPSVIREVLAEAESLVEANFPQATSQQTAWDTLTRLDENLKGLAKAERALARAVASQRKAEILLRKFEAVRDRVLGRLYDEVGDRLAELYRMLHEADEGRFEACLRPEGAGLNIEVEFFGRGKHPPHALHSEGHQDSLGMCLYLALAERLTEGLIDLVILDDVVMSIDADHRRRVCTLLASAFPGKQFLITTHDRTWAAQLIAEGVVSSHGSVQFGRWTIDTGPIVAGETDLWSVIDKQLKLGDVPNAAFHLRRGSEHFFEMACDALQARVKYRSDARWELGDFLPSATAKYLKLLRRAKSAANSFNDKESLERLQEFESVAKQIISRSNMEQWGINPNVHYSRWHEFSENDFRPVAQAFHDLYGLFRCSKCGGMLRLVLTGGAPICVRCACGAVDWNLQTKA